MLLAGTKLTELFRRLEAATSRLEDMATSIDSTHPATVEAITTAATASAQPNGTAGARAASTPEPLPPAVEDFDKLIKEEVTAFVSVSEKIDRILADQVGRVLVRASHP